MHVDVTYILTATQLLTLMKEAWMPLVMSVLVTSLSAFQVIRFLPGRVFWNSQGMACLCSCVSCRNEESLGKLQHSMPPPGHGPVEPDKLVNGASSGTSSEEPSPIRRMPSELPIIKEAPVVDVVPGVKEQVPCWPLCPGYDSSLHGQDDPDCACI